MRNLLTIIAVLLVLGAGLWQTANRPAPSSPLRWEMNHSLQYAWEGRP